MQKMAKSDRIWVFYIAGGIPNNFLPNIEFDIVL